MDDLNKALIVKMSDLVDTTSQKLPTFPDEVNSPFSNHNKDGNFFQQNEGPWFGGQAIQNIESIHSEVKSVMSSKKNYKRFLSENI